MRSTKSSAERCSVAVVGCSAALAASPAASPAAALAASVAVAPAACQTASPAAAQAAAQAAALAASPAAALTAALAAPPAAALVAPPAATIVAAAVYASARGGRSVRASACGTKAGVSRSGSSRRRQTSVPCGRIPRDRGRPAGRAAPPDDRRTDRWDATDQPVWGFCSLGA